MKTLPSHYLCPPQSPARSTAGDGEGFLLHKNMIVEEVTNRDEGTALSVSECGIWMETPRGMNHHRFDTSVDVMWLIHRLNSLYAEMREGERLDREEAREKQRARKGSNPPVSIEETKAKFSELRRMLSVSGGDNT